MNHETRSRIATNCLALRGPAWIRLKMLNHWCLLGCFFKNLVSRDALNYFFVDHLCNEWTGAQLNYNVRGRHLSREKSCAVWPNCQRGPRRLRDLFLGYSGWLRFISYSIRNKRKAYVYVNMHWSKCVLQAFWTEILLVSVRDIQR